MFYEMLPYMLLREAKGEICYVAVSLELFPGTAPRCSCVALLEDSGKFTIGVSLVLIPLLWLKFSKLVGESLI
jgi:hypothetical protein